MDTLNPLIELAPYLKEPLVLLGFVLLLVFGIHKTLIKSGIIPPIGTRTVGRIVQTILRYGFWLAVRVISNGTLANFANPHKWWRLLNKYPSLQNMRNNFAHFGGEDGVEKVLMWNDEAPDQEQLYLSPGGLFSSSWRYWIIRLIKQYPYAFSDISAFDFSDKKAIARMAWLIHRDAKGAYDEFGKYKLIDKLMWGSDIPMILSGHGTYCKLFDAFYNSLDSNYYDSGNYGMPTEFLLGRDLLFERLVQNNPKRFLFRQGRP